jgi:hypothetical protein
VSLTFFAIMFHIFEIFHAARDATVKPWEDKY